MTYLIYFVIISLIIFALALLYWFRTEESHVDVYELREEGDANFYTIFRNGNWFMRIQMNGEMTTLRQRVYLTLILITLRRN